MKSNPKVLYAPKMRKAICVALFALFGAVGAIAQVTFTVTDGENDLPIYNAVITLKAIGSETIYSGLTKGDGRCELVLPNGGISKWVLVLQHISYHQYVDTLSSADLMKEATKVSLRPNGYKLDDVVVTGQYDRASASKSIHQVTVINRQKIEAMAAVNLKDVLNNEMNIRVGQDNILGSSMSLQGISGQNVKILIDGVPVIGRLDGNIDLSQINLNNVERIEVVQGPLSVNYGTNALAGTINIITKKKYKKKYGAQADAYYENIGNHNLLGSAHAQWHKTTVGVSAGRNYFDGWNATDPFWQDYQRPIADERRFKQWKPKEQYFGRLSIGQQVRKLSLNYRGEYFWENILNRGLPRPPYKEMAFDDTYLTNRIDHALSLNRSGKLGTLNGVVGFNVFERRKNTYVKDLTNLDQKLTTNLSDHDTSAFTALMSRASWSSKRKHWFNYQVGYDVNYETALGRRIDEKTREMGDYSAFLTSEMRVKERWLLKPAVRFSHNTVYQSPIIPSFNLKYNKENFTFRSSYARGFRAPSLKELYFLFVDINHNIVGNDNLQAEFSNNYTANAQWKTLRRKAIYQWSLSGFYNDIDNLITLAQTSGTQYSYINVGAFSTYGFNAGAELVTKKLKTQLNAGLTARSSQLGKALNQPYTHSPEFRANVQYRWDEKGLRFSTFFKYLGVQPGFGVNSEGETVETEIAAYSLADATITKHFGSQKLALSLGVKNLFNVVNVQTTAQSAGAHSSSAASMPVATGRVAFAKLSLSI